MLLSQVQMEFTVSSTPYLDWCSLRWLKPRRSLVDSFIPHGLLIPKMVLGECLVSSKGLFLKKKTDAFKISFFLV